MGVGVAACVIAKNEEKNLPRLLESIRGKFDQIVVVDTGSTDRTVEIARSYGCKVVKHRWQGFADARNRAISEVDAPVDWIWHFDADFELEEEEYRKALRAFKEIPPEVDSISIGVRNFDQFGRIKAISSHIFIHRNDPSIRWEGAVHESPTVKCTVGLPIFVNHYGYADLETLLKKGKRNLELLKQELERYKGKDPFEYSLKLFFLIQTYTLLAREEPAFRKEALKACREFFSISGNNLKDYGFFLVYTYNYYLFLLLQEELYREFEEVLNNFKELKVEHPDILLLEFSYWRQLGNRKEAQEAILKFALLADEVEKNPFAYPYTAVSESTLAFENMVIRGELGFEPDEEFIERVRKLWRKKKGKFLGLLLYLLTNDEKVLKKVALRYPSVTSLILTLKSKLGGLPNDNSNQKTTTKEVGHGTED
ncbi:glycosyl transferase family 2 [Thermovibrio ammonificans HB-1]|uniref:Glycosyl transferase family 2 n=1 Tax=Thermovibrio ammonificans (strain DSM 15698 / JCM 12110 / HB-1) TaxID=648996 RepID=E8T2N2_THEA1|nr:glycosyltransferase family 2 protein [Thermovibrio ammonificans]ADU97127.1 glycosyl transferase family 2 [Thermovibrio ammonificans HB-1]